MALHRPIRGRQYVVWLLLFLFLLACTLTSMPAARPPERLYVFDVSDLHLNHYDHCLTLAEQPGPCDTGRPPPGKSFDDLLRDYDTLVFLATLQGLVNRDGPDLYLFHDRPAGAPGVDDFWLARYREPRRPYGWLSKVEIVELHTLGQVLDVFADRIEGVVVWDPAVPATLNVATTVAGVENLAVLRAGSRITAEVTRYLAVKRSLVGLFSADGSAVTLPDSLTPSTGSAKADAYLWAKEKYLDTGLANPRFLAYLEDGWPAALYSREKMTRGGVYALERDYVVQQRGFAFDLSPWADERPNDDPDQPLGADTSTLQTILAAAETQAGGSLIKVWGFIPWYEKYASPPGAGSIEHSPVAGEWESTWLFSQHGAYLQGGGGDVFGLALANVSVHRFGAPPSPRPAPSDPSERSLARNGYLDPAGRIAPARTFVMFYAGDYDLAHPVYTLMANHATTPWLDPRRGDVPVGWGLNPALVEDIPAIISYLFTTKTDLDYFVGANSGAGYLNPDAASEATLLRWLWRTRYFYTRYGYNIQGFLLNGNGAAMSQRRLDAFALLTPAGILTPDFEIDEPWPRLQLGAPLSAMEPETLAHSPDLAALAVQAANQRRRAEDRPPFLAFRSSFLSPTFLWGVRDRLQVHDAGEQIVTSDGEVLPPNYTVVDPNTFFFLMERWLKQR